MKTTAHVTNRKNKKTKTLESRSPPIPRTRPRIQDARRLPPARFQHPRTSPQLRLPAGFPPLDEASAAPLPRPALCQTQIRFLASIYAVVVAAAGVGGLVPYRSRRRSLRGARGLKKPPHALAPGARMLECAGAGRPPLRPVLPLAAPPPTPELSGPEGGGCS